MARQTHKTQAIPDDSPQAMRQEARSESRAALDMTPRPRVVPKAAETPPAAAAKAGGQEAWDPLANTEALNALTKANQAMLDGMAELQREMMAFGSARLHRDLAHQEALTQCKDLQETMQAHAEFAQQAVQHYAEEASRWFDLSAKLGRDCWGPVEEASRAAFQPVKPR